MFVEYATLEQMLMRLFEVDDSQRAALRGRFKYIRPRVLDKDPIGRGIARYELDDILRIVMVLELEDAGCSPTHAIRIVRNHWDDLQGYFGDAWDAVRAREGGETSEALLWAVMPHLLREMGSGRGGEAITLTEPAGYLGMSKVAEWPVAGLTGHRHATFVNLPHLLAACCEALATMGNGTDRHFRAALDQLARETLAEAEDVA